MLEYHKKVWNHFRFFCSMCAVMGPFKTLKCLMDIPDKTLPPCLLPTSCYIAFVVYNQCLFCTVYISWRFISLHCKNNSYRDCLWINCNPENWVLLKYPGPALIWEGGPVCFCRFYWRFLHKIEKSIKTKIKDSKEKYIFFWIHIDLTTWPNLTKFCSLTLAGASPRTP